MTARPKAKVVSTKALIAKLRDKSPGSSTILLFAHNGTGKTRLSVAFKNIGKNPRRGIERDTLYFNAFTEDLFTWDNDLSGDERRVIKINSSSRFFNGLAEFPMDIRIRDYLDRYVKFDFFIDYENWEISFYEKPLTVESPRIKISRGEERIFVWCFFLAIVQLTFEGAETYDWVKYLYIDDPISSLDDSNCIAVASDLANLLKKFKSSDIKFIISTHHTLFFNVLYNELRKDGIDSFYIAKSKQPKRYNSIPTNDIPFYNHIAMLNEIKEAVHSGKLYTYHFNMLRNVLEKTAIFFGHEDFSYCLKGIDDEILHSRALNLLSHGQHSIYEPKQMGEDTENLFKKILENFLTKYSFELL